MTISGKTILQIILNLAAAAAIGIIVGLYYKYLYGDGPVPAETEEMSDFCAGLDSIAASVDARIGVAAVYGPGDTLVWSNVASSGTDESLSLCGERDVRFPMMSVMKFHQALAVCDFLRRSSIPLDSEVDVPAGSLEDDTWSPLRDAHPEGGAFSYAELLTYSLAMSDNNACDILFGCIGGPDAVDSYIRSLGLSDFRIACTEAEMHSDRTACLRNWTTPLSAVRLLEVFWDRRDSDEYHRFVWDTMSGCETGQERIPGRISDRVQTIAHKTGTGDMLSDGRVSAVNDIGIVVLPNGRHFSLAVFVCDAACTMLQCESLIADIAGLLLEYAEEYAG